MISHCKIAKLSFFILATLDGGVKGQYGGGEDYSYLTFPFQKNKESVKMVDGGTGVIYTLATGDSLIAPSREGCRIKFLGALDVRKRNTFPSMITIQCPARSTALWIKFSPNQLRRAPFNYPSFQMQYGLRYRVLDVNTPSGIAWLISWVGKAWDAITRRNRRNVIVDVGRYAPRQDIATFKDPTGAGQTATIEVFKSEPGKGKYKKWVYIPVEEWIGSIGKAEGIELEGGHVDEHYHDHVPQEVRDEEDEEHDELPRYEETYQRHEEYRDEEYVDSDDERLLAPVVDIRYSRKPVVVEETSYEPADLPFRERPRSALELTDKIISSSGGVIGTNPDVERDNVQYD